MTEMIYSFIRRCFNEVLQVRDLSDTSKYGKWDVGRISRVYSRQIL